jgi:hypothetical protein
LDDVFLGRRSFLQEAASLTLKIKEGKMCERKRETKAAFEGACVRTEIEGRFLFDHVLCREKIKPL